jgi:hypothetical protein
MAAENSPDVEKKAKDQANYIASLQSKLVAQGVSPADALEVAKATGASVHNCCNGGHRLE